MPPIFFFRNDAAVACRSRVFVLQSIASRLRPAFFAQGMKNEFAFLYPAPRSVRFVGGVLDIRSLCFPLEMSKKYDFLFEHFRVRSGSLGLEVVFQERRDLAGEAYAIDAGPERIVLSAGTPRARFFALSTLMQILAFHESSGCVPAFVLRDAPALAFRGFLFAGAGDVPPAGRLRGMLLELALLKFSHFALPARSVRQDRGGAGGGLDALAALARKMGMELILLDADIQAVFHLGRTMESGSSPGAPVFFATATSGEGTRPADWLEFFRAQHKRGGAQGERTAVWGDMFLRHPEWIRKLPQDILVLNRARSPERGEVFRAAILPFKKHHIPQALCPILCDRDRFLPDARAGMARVSAACAAAAAGKLAGVMLASCEPGGCECLAEGAAMLHFQAGCLLWSATPPGPGAFSRWALGRDEPDLFRVYSFLAQAEHRLPHSHCRYLFEDPLLAPYSRQGDPNEIGAHFLKAALYLKKRKIGGGEQPRVIVFARKMYEVIAAKVEFSSRLGRLLGEAEGGEEVRRRAAGIERGARELKYLYLGLRGKDVSPADVGRGLKGFDLLSQRLADLRRASSSPAAREELLRELRKSSLLASLAAPGDDEAESP